MNEKKLKITAKNATIKDLRLVEDNSSKDKNQRTETGWTQDMSDDLEGDGSGNGYQPGTGPSDWEKDIEEAEVLPFGNKDDKEDIVIKSDLNEKMDEILKNNDKFETVKVIMEILCKELGIPKDSQLDVVGRELNKVWEAYWKSMKDWRELTKKPVNNDIRQ